MSDFNEINDEKLLIELRDEVVKEARSEKAENDVVLVNEVEAAVIDVEVEVEKDGVVVENEKTT